MKKYFTKEALLNYLYGALSGRLLGFFVASGATGILSKFFETPTMRNLWGLTAKRPLLSKGTYENLEWILSVVIGYFVFEIFEKVVRKNVARHWPTYYQKGKSYMAEKGYDQKLEEIKTKVIVTTKEKTSEGKKKFEEVIKKLKE